MILTQADTMNSPVVGVLLGTLLGTALGKEQPIPLYPHWLLSQPGSSTSSFLPGNQMRCYDCKGGPGSSCKETVATCREGERCGFLERKPQPGLGPNKLSGNRESSVSPSSPSPSLPPAPTSILLVSRTF